MSIRDGIGLGAERLRAPGTIGACLLALAFELGVALLERAQGASGASDRALSGGAFGIALPLLCYFLATRTCDARSVREAVLPLARHGLDRRGLVVGLAVPAVLVSAVFAALSGVAVVLLTRGLHDASWLRDAATSLWIGAVGGAAYVAMFVGASAFGQHGRGRAWLLAADFLLGAGTSFLALPWPKGHVRNLLGGAPVLELPQFAALLVMLGMSFAFLSWGALRTER
jgi:hypothetical protein